MFSGGLDSTGAFWQLLKDGEKIYIHHMHLKNVENRHEAEAKAVREILEFMKPYGTFEYSESTHEYPSFKGRFMMDADITSFMAGQICKAMPWIKNVALGLTKSDIDNNSVQARIENANKVFSALCNAQKIYPIKHLTKQEIYEMLPVELRNLTWSCRMPIYKQDQIKKCGKCITCQTIKKEIYV